MQRLENVDGVTVIVAATQTWCGCQPRRSAFKQQMV